MQECSKVFREKDALLLKKLPHIQSGPIESKIRATMLKRLRWPAIKGKIEFLKSNLDRMKSTLTLMLNVIIFAKQVLERSVSVSSNFLS